MSSSELLLAATSRERVAKYVWRKLNDIADGGQEFLAEQLGHLSYVELAFVAGAAVSVVSFLMTERERIRREEDPLP